MRYFAPTAAPVTTSLRRALLLLVVLLTATAARAQTTLTGRAIDLRTQEALSFSTVVLKTAGEPATIVTSALADAQGNFVLKASQAGNYQLQVLMLGYATHTQPVVLAAGPATVSLGTIGLQPATQQLGEVTVTAQRQLLLQKPDRVVMNVGESLLGAGNDAYSILGMAPSVQLLEGKLTFRGKANVLIYLNGKRLPGANLEAVLASIPGDQIDRIELISNPSAKYDADASGGVIEIYTKRSKTLGWNANLGGNLSQGQRRGSGLNGGLRLSSPKLDFVTNASLASKGGFERGSYRRTLYQGFMPVASLEQQNDLDKTLRDNSFSTSLNYHFTPKTTIGFDFDLTQGSLTGAGWTRATVTERAGLTRNRVEDEVYLSQTFVNYTLFAKHQLDSLGSSLLVSGNYARFSSTQQQTFGQYLQVPSDSLETRSSFRNDIPATYRIYTGVLDYAKIWNACTRLETGLKYTATRNESRQLIQTLQNGEWPAGTTNLTGYQEHIGAAYLNLNQTVGKLSLQAGLRGELTRYRVGAGPDSSYVNLFPNLRADYQVSDSYSTSLAYAENIHRPAYESLIPYERLLDTYTSTKGNAALRPEYAHSLSWNHLYKGYGLQLSHTITPNAISSVYTYDQPQQRLVYTQQNVARQHLTSLTLTAPYSPAKWWSMTNTGNLYHRELSFPNPLDNAAVLRKSKTYFTLSSDNTFNLGHGWSTRLYALYNSPSFNGLTDYDSYSYVMLSAKKSFWDKKASLKLDVLDLFYQLNFQVSSNVVPVVNTSINYNDTRRVRLSFTYNLGKTDLKSKRVETTGNAAERNRLGQ
ncbi:outer membrane beta-barrel protein [Hymenobacter cellulosivorans]|uniref:TonB-dependent receptor n=1 Tax=Hymenobacter cellulosivorans TaxID=2932249 RepID=A0ABY4F454_9BACT|nr:outer membrane beta-barrel protein [Hymenobacter cellulosivorans]UOQ51427.1 TonB-dependent receptor [Hymenobacter cellulosivorans]